VTGTSTLPPPEKKDCLEPPVCNGKEWNLLERIAVNAAEWRMSVNSALSCSCHTFLPPTCTLTYPRPKLLDEVDLIILRVDRLEVLRHLSRKASLAFGAPDG